MGFYLDDAITYTNGKIHILIGKIDDEKYKNCLYVQRYVMIVDAEHNVLKKDIINKMVLDYSGNKLEPNTSNTNTNWNDVYKEFLKDQCKWSVLVRRELEPIVKEFIY